MDDWLIIDSTLAVLLFSSFVCIGLLALWAAESPVHWFARSMVLAAVVSLPLLIPARELPALFAIEALVVVLGAVFWRWWKGRRQNVSGVSSHEIKTLNKSGIRFSLKTLLQTAVLMGVLVAIAAGISEQSSIPWTTLILGGTVGGCAVLLGAWVFASTRKWIAALAALVLSLGLAIIIAANDWFLPSFVIIAAHPLNPGSTSNFLADLFRPNPELTWFVIMPAVAGVTWFVLSVWWIGRWQTKRVGELQDEAGQSRIVRRIASGSILVVLLGLLIVPPAYFFWMLLHPTPMPKIAAPSPNGLDDVIVAGRAFETSPILSTDVQSKTTQELAAEVAKYRDTYAQLRVGLSKEILLRTWPESDAPMSAFDLSIDSLQLVRSVARGLMMEAELAQQQTRYFDAAKISLENVYLGIAIAHDGILTDYFVGEAIEAIGHDTLYKALPHLNAGESREVIAKLVDLDRRRDSYDEVSRRDRAWSDHAYGWAGHLYLLVNDFVQPHQVDVLAHSALHRKQAIVRLLTLESALRAYQLEHGELPEHLQELMPVYIAELPADPFDVTGKPLRYVRNKQGYVVYSVGPDGNDDGGQPPPPGQYGGFDLNGDGDLRLDDYFKADD